MTKTLSELRETRLLQAVSDARKLTTTLALFSLAIAGAGAVRLNQTQAIGAELARYSKNIGKDWEPIESFYERSAYMLQDFAAENSTPWSQSFVIITTWLVALETVKPTPTLKRNIERYSATGRTLHQYNSDIRTIAAAQRRNLGFRDLSARELEAAVRIANHRLTPEQESTIGEAPQMAAMILTLSQKLQENASQRNDALTQILHLKNPKTRAILQDIAGGRKWSDASARFLTEDLYYSAARGDDRNFERLHRDVKALPAPTISAAEEKLAQLAAQKTELDADAGLALPLLGIRVAAAHITLATGIINALLAAAVCALLLRALGELQAMKRLAPDQPEELYVLMVRDMALDRRDTPRGIALAAVLASPSIAALALFGKDAARPIVSWLTAGIMLIVILLIAAALVLARRLYRSAAQPG